MNNIIDNVSTEFNKYSKYITFATVIAATAVGAIVIYGLITKKG